MIPSEFNAISVDFSFSRVNHYITGLFYVNCTLIRSTVLTATQNLGMASSGSQARAGTASVSGTQRRALVY
jgi:hypothetical protein